MDMFVPYTNAVDGRFPKRTKDRARHVSHRQATTNARAAESINVHMPWNDARGKALDVVACTSVTSIV